MDQIDRHNLKVIKQKPIQNGQRKNERDISSPMKRTKEIQDYIFESIVLK